MEGFSAVVTTGIYCRRGCSGRPHPGNVLTFETAAAAEASGFRACHRCRPYRTERPFGWSAPELVCRGVQMIVDGALDHGTETDLGHRLGVSARHLRRLFLAHVGVTPDQLARSRRAHFARRLLDDTDLSVTQVAFAAGFGSVRQLNRACVDIFRAPPRELRDRRRQSDRLVADGGLVLRMPYAGPLDWDAMLTYFSARAIPGVESVSAAEGAYRRTVIIDGDPAVLEVFPDCDDEDSDSVEPHHLLLRLHLPHWAGLIHVVERARRVFSLDAPPDEAARHLAGDPVVGELVAARPGMRVPGTWDPFETGIRAILGQQVSVRAASTMTGRLVERLGQPVPGLQDLGLSHTFPDPEMVATADLSGIGLTGARAEAVQAFARAVASEEVRLDRSVPLDALVGSLTAVRGVGPWTAQYLALRLGERDAFPAGDLGLRNALARRLTGSGVVRPETVAERWRPWRAAAAVHLWSSLADAPAATASAVPLA